MKQEPKSFEVAGYSDVDFGIKEAHQTIMQIFREVVRDNPAHAVWGDMVGDKLKIHYNAYVMHLPVRMNRTEEEAEDAFKQTVALLKKEFKKRTGKALKLSEDKDLAGRSVQKVSLNERYMFQAWRFYTLSF